MQKQNVLLIINPVAGRKKAKSMIYRIVDSLCRNNCKTTIYITAKKGDATDIVTQYAEEFEKVVCCGGDGTLNEVISGLAQLKLQIPIGYIPTGTTNDLAHSLQLPTNIDDAIEVAVNGSIRRHDIGMFNENLYFSYVSSFGAFTKVSYGTPQWLKNIFGRAAYIFKGIFSIANIRSQKAKIIADGNEINGDFVYGSVSNSTIIGGLVKLLKTDVSFDDGMFEVLLIKKPRKIKEYRNILRGISKHDYNNKYTYFFRAKNLSFTFEKSTEWSIDGEYAGTPDSVQIKNLYAAQFFQHNSEETQED